MTEKQSFPAWKYMFVFLLYMIFYVDFFTDIIALSSINSEIRTDPCFYNTIIPQFYSDFVTDQNVNPFSQQSSIYTSNATDWTGTPIDGGSGSYFDESNFEGGQVPTITLELDSSDPSQCIIPVGDRSGEPDLVCENPQEWAKTFTLCSWFYDTNQLACDDWQCPGSTPFNDVSAPEGLTTTVPPATSLGMRLKWRVESFRGLCKACLAQCTSAEYVLLPPTLPEQSNELGEVVGYYNCGPSSTQSLDDAWADISTTALVDNLKDTCDPSTYEPSSPADKVCTLTESQNRLHLTSFSEDNSFVSSSLIYGTLVPIMMFIIIAKEVIKTIIFILMFLTASTRNSVAIPFFAQNLAALPMLLCYGSSFGTYLLNLNYNKGGSVKRLFFDLILEDLPQIFITGPFVLYSRVSLDSIVYISLVFTIANSVLALLRIMYVTFTAFSSVDLNAEDDSQKTKPVKEDLEEDKPVQDSVDASNATTAIVDAVTEL